MAQLHCRSCLYDSSYVVLLLIVLLRRMLFLFVLHAGDGVQPSAQEAFRWYAAAAEKGHQGAMYNCGLLLFQGISTTFYTALQVARCVPH